MASFPGWRRPRGALFGLEDVDVGEVAVAPGEVYAVAYDELVWDLEAEVSHAEIHLPPRRLGQERADLQGGGLALQKRAPQVGEGQARVYDVLDEQDVPAVMSSSRSFRMRTTPLLWVPAP